MSDTPYKTRPVRSDESILRDKFAESVVAQSDQLDKLGRQLITIELAVPGLYAAILKLVQGRDATVAVDDRLLLTFGAWLLASLLTMISLIPRRWHVDPTILRQGDAEGEGQPDKLGLEDFYYRSARYKWILLIAAVILFWAGVLGAVWVLF